MGAAPGTAKTPLGLGTQATPGRCSPIARRGARHARTFVRIADSGAKIFYQSRIDMRPENADNAQSSMEVDMTERSAAIYRAKAAHRSMMTRGASYPNFTQLVLDSGWLWRDSNGYHVWLKVNGALVRADKR